MAAVTIACSVNFISQCGENETNYINIHDYHTVPTELLSVSDGKKTDHFVIRHPRDRNTLI